MPKFGEDIDPAEAGRKGGQRSAEVRANRREMNPLERARAVAAQDVEKAIRLVKDAAEGKNGFEDLDLMKRVDAAKVWLNVAGIRTSGAPTVVPATPDEPKDDEPFGYDVEESDAETEAPTDPGEVHPGQGDV